MGASCEEEAQLRLISELRGLYREAFPASRHVMGNSWERADLFFLKDSLERGISYPP
jgi:hypothetical protein